MSLFSIFEKAAFFATGITWLVIFQALGVWHGFLWRDDSALIKERKKLQHDLWSLEAHNRPYDEPTRETYRTSRSGDYSKEQNVRLSEDQILQHDFVSMKEDLQLHYLTPAIPPERVQHLVIFLHGFPDSCQIFRHYLQSELAACARLVALDLPGFGGSDSLPRYGPNQVLSTVARAIGLLKERYLPEKRNGEQCVLVGHDWGGIVAWRTAMETTGLIDSVVIINAPLPQLFLRNLSLRFEKAASLFKKDRNPTHGNVFSQAKALAGPAVKQFFMSGYIFMFQLPISTRRFPSVINFLLTKCHETWTGDTSYSPAWAWASSIGPGIEQCDDPAQWHSYGRTVLERAVNHPFGDWDERIRYYKEGLLTRDWTLRGEFSNYALPSARDHEPQDLRKLQCSASILFGTKDLALHYKICTEGWEACVQESRFPDTKAFDSQLVLIEDCGHWSPLEKAGRDRIREHLLRLVAPPESIYS